MRGISIVTKQYLLHCSKELRNNTGISGTGDPNRRCQMPSYTWPK